MQILNLAAKHGPSNPSACNKALGCDSVILVPGNFSLTRKARITPPTSAAPRSEFADCTVPDRIWYFFRSLSSAFRPAPRVDDHHIGASMPRPSGLPLDAICSAASSTDETVRLSTPPRASRNAKPKPPTPPGSAPTQNLASLTLDFVSPQPSSASRTGRSASAHRRRPCGPEGRRCSWTPRPCSPRRG